MTDIFDLIDPLADALAALECDHHFVVARAGSTWFMTENDTNRYVQFVVYEGGLRAESVGDRYLESGARLTPEQIVRLDELGWSLPDDGGNYWRQWDEPVPFREVAELAVRTLFHVHQAVYVEQLDVSGPPEIERLLGVLDEIAPGDV